MDGKKKVDITIALAGNPNSGKTSIFNALTGTHQHVGNYPGVTVEIKEGVLFYKYRLVKVVDLPGTYSLTAYSEEERVARDFVLNRSPQVVVDVVDATNLERNLYLVTQFIELGMPLVIALNMSDMAKAQGLEFDLDRLSQLLGAPVIPTEGHRGRGRDSLLDAVLFVARGEWPFPAPRIRYGQEIEDSLNRIEPACSGLGVLEGRLQPRWLALKLLESDEEYVERAGKEGEKGQEVLRIAAEESARIKSLLGEDPDVLVAGQRYGFISGACLETVKSTVESRHSMSDQIDAVLTHKYLGFPIFFLFMYLTFYLTFTLGDPVVNLLENFFVFLKSTFAQLWPQGSESVLKLLLVDGVLSGVGGVVIFLPNIMLLFLAISFLEDSGYMARAAFLMDNLMHRIGLHGRSFIPMLMGFGCSVPAILGTRVLESRRDRITTMLIIPLFSCSGRLPIYGLLIPAFFPRKLQAPVLWMMYIIGILLAVAGAKVLRATLFKGESAPFVMELPPYRTPTVKGALIHMWERALLYLKKAGTVILAVSVILWFATSYPKPPREVHREAGSALEAREIALSHSVAGRVGKAMEPAIRLLGFDWRVGTALIGAFGAKEVFVAQMGIVFSVESAEEVPESLQDKKQDPLRQKLRENYSPLQGFCIILFCLISAPCVATLAVTRKESGSWKWALFQLVGLTALGFLFTGIVFQAGTLLQIGVGKL